MYDQTATPIFNEVAKNFKEKNGYDLFSVIVTEGDGYNVVPRAMVDFDNFATSFPNEWMVYHVVDNDTSALRIPPWTGAEPTQVEQCKHGVSYAYACPTCDWADDLMTAQDVMHDQAVGMAEIVEKLRTRSSVVVPEDDAEIITKTFDELEEVDRNTFLEKAKAHLADVENMAEHELSYELVYEQAVRMYEEGPIKMLHTNPSNQPSVVDLAEVVRVGVETGLIEVKDEE